MLSQATGSRDFAFSGADNASIHHLVRMPADPTVPGRDYAKWVVRRFNDTNHLRTRFTTAPEPAT